MNETLNKKYRDFILYTWVILLIGFILLTLGIIRLIFFEPRIGINLRTLHPVVINGAFIFILGLLFFSVGIYRILNRTKSFKSQIDIEKEIKESENKNRKKTIRR